MEETPLMKSKIGFANHCSTFIALAGLMALSACGKTATQGAGQPSAGQSTLPASVQIDPDLSVATFSPLLTIISDMNGRTVNPVYFNLQLLLSPENEIQGAYFVRHGSTRKALPGDETKASATVRADLCKKNADASQESCLIDLKQLRQGVVLTRHLGDRSASVIQIASDFSPKTGGKLTMHYLVKADLNDATKDIYQDYEINVDRDASGNWEAVANDSQGHHAFTRLKLKSTFCSLYACGIREIEARN
jgi:hypothetical protein